MSRCSLVDSAGRCNGTIKSRTSFTDQETDILRRRSGKSRVDYVCDSHFKHFMIFFPLNQLKCCDPFQKHKKVVKASLQEISLSTVKECIEFGVLGAPLIPGKKLCSNCMKDLSSRIYTYKESEQSRKDQSAPNEEPTGDEEHQPGGSQGQEPESSQEELAQGSEDFDELHPTPPDTALSDLNKCLSFIGLDPIDTRKLSVMKRYASDKVEEIQRKVKSKLERISGCVIPKPAEIEAYEQILTQLEEKFHSTSDKNVKMQILSVLPKTWSIRQVAERFNAPLSMVRAMKSLVNEQGIIPKSRIRSRQGLSQQLIEKIIEFYIENSRMLPGKKDCVSVREGDKRVMKQKMLVLMTLKELHINFCKTNGQAVSFSKFAELRPRQCVLAGASGTHCVCVCIYHENFSLLLDACQFEKLVEGRKKIMSLSDILDMILCENPKPECFFLECPKCPGFLPLQEMMEVHFDELVQTEVEFKKWTNTDRSNFETCIESVEVFMENVLSLLPDFLKHHFISKAQNKFLDDLKKVNLKDKECIVTGDFSENYSPVIQNATQGVHWQKTQTTIHPFVCYYKEDCSLKVFNFVIISDSLSHDTQAVYAFQHKLISALKKIIPDLKKIYYFSDGAKSQYKNRTNALILRMHFFDFGIIAEWHFFASCHGKGACDGLGGTIKREAARESLHRFGRDGIVTPKQLYEWAREKFSTSMVVEFVSAEEIASVKNNYIKRFTDPPPLEGIASCHCIVPLSENVLLMQSYSAASTCHYVYYGELANPKFEDLHGFVVVSEKDGWHLALVNERNNEERSIVTLYLDKEEKNFKFSFPTEERNAVKRLEDIICIVNVTVDNDNKFALKPKDRKYADDEQEKRYPKENSSSSRPQKRKR